MPKYCALTVRKLKPGSYDDWRKAWWPEDDDTTPDNAKVYIVRNVNDENEVIAFGIVEGEMDDIRSSMNPDAERRRQEAMAPFIDSVGADGIYEVVEEIET